MTTVAADGAVNVAPMGPIVEGNMRRLLLRPYNTSTTYANLKRTGQGVFHVTDNVDMLARAAVGRLEPPPEFWPAHAVEGFILADACRWYAVKIRSIDDSRPRTEIVADVIDSGRQRDFFGWNRAGHAVLEAAILATRIDFLPAEDIMAELERLRVPIEKTGGSTELSAFEFLSSYVRSAIELKETNLG